MDSTSSLSEEEIGVKEGLTILILGGLNSDITKNLLNYLVNKNEKNNKEKKIKFIKLVDKYLILPELKIINCYLDKTTKKNLLEGIKSGLVEYEQLNLLLESSQIKAFTLPPTHQTTPSTSYDIVYDLTSPTLQETLSLPLITQIERTVKLSLSLGSIASSFRVGTYTKLLTPFYKLSNKKDGKVGEEEGEEECWGVLSKLLNESVRGLSLIKDLNLVVIRPGIIYGGFTLEGITSRILIAQLYKNNSESLDFLWSAPLPQSTIHILDLIHALYLTSLWSLKNGLSSSLSLAGEVLSFSLSSTGKEEKENEMIKEGIKGLDLKGLAGEKEECKVVLFNVVDEGEMRLGDIKEVIGSAIGIKIGFQNSLISKMVKMNIKDSVEDINDKHQELFLSSTSTSSNNIQISPIIPLEYLQPYPISLSSCKITRLLRVNEPGEEGEEEGEGGGWKAVRKLDVTCVKEIVEGWKEEGGWLDDVEEGGGKGKGKK